MCPKDWRIPGEVVKVIHNDSHKQVEHEEATEKDKGNKEWVGNAWSTFLVWIQQFSIGSVSFECSRITFSPCFTSQHDIGPSLPSCTPGLKSAFSNKMLWEWEVFHVHWSVRLSGKNKTVTIIRRTESRCCSFPPYGHVWINMSDFNFIIDIS